MPIAVAYGYSNACVQEGKIIVLHCLAVTKVSAYVCHVFERLFKCPFS